MFPDALGTSSDGIHLFDRFVRLPQNLRECDFSATRLVCEDREQNALFSGLAQVLDTRSGTVLLTAGRPGTLYLLLPNSTVR